MEIGDNIKRLREAGNMKQSEIADLIGMHRSIYSRIENGQREISLAAVDKIADYFNISIDELIHMGNDIPKEISLEDKTTVEQVKLIQEVDQEEKNMVFKMIVTFLTKKKFKDFFQKGKGVAEELRKNPNREDILDTIAKLQELKESGAISEKEYESTKKELLAKLKEL